MVSSYIALIQLSCLVQSLRNVVPPEKSGPLPGREAD